MPVPAPSQISICNQALDLIRASTIADINEASLEAEKCALHYPAAVSRMLEGPYDFSFANQRVQLALTANARPNQWRFAYLVPQNCASPIAVLRNSVGSNIPDQNDLWHWRDRGRDYSEPYEIEAGIIYTNVCNAWFDYSINDIDGVIISSLAADALVLELASRIVVPIKGDSAAKKDLIGQAELAWQRAIANDQNRQPQHYGDYVSESILVRHMGGPAPASDD